MQAAKAALPVEKPRLAAIETKFVDDLDGLSLEELEAIADGREEEFRRSRDAGGGGIGKRSPPLKRVK